MLRGSGRVGGASGEGGGEGGRKKPQVKTRGDQLPTDGPDHTTRPSVFFGLSSDLEFS